MDKKVLKTLGITTDDIKRYLESQGGDIRYAGLMQNPINYSALHTDILIKGNARPVILHYSRSGNSFAYWSRKIEVSDHYKNSKELNVVDLLEWFNEGKTEDKEDLIKFIKEIS
jgi:hypothetical protein